MAGEFRDLKQSYFSLRHSCTGLDWNEVPSLQPFQMKLKEITRIFEGKVQEANKAVYDKNRQISDLFNRNNELTQQVESVNKTASDANSKVIYEKNRQIGDLFN